MSSIPLPPGVRINGFAMPLQAVTRAHSSPFGGDGAESVVDLLQDRWTASVSTSATTPAEARAVEAWLNGLRGGVNTTPLHHHRYPVPAGTLGRVYPVAGMAGDAAQGASSVLLATVNNATLLAGDMFRVGGDTTGAGGLLLQCAADCAAPATGEGYITVPITNRLRRAVTGFRRASSATLVDSGGVVQTVGPNILRYQGGAPLVEGATTNLLSAPEAFDSAAWTKQGTIVTPGLWDPAPNGQQFVADAVFETAANEQHDLYAIGSSLGTSWSIFVKPVNRRYIGIYAFQGGLMCGQTFDLQAGSLGQAWAAGAPVAALLQPLANGWWRIGIQSAVPFGVGACILLNGNVSGPPSYMGDTGSGAYMWGAQHESGPITAYTPAARAADVLPAVAWNRPARPFRLATRTGLRHVPGYAEGLVLDFVEDLAS